MFCCVVGRYCCVYMEVGDYWNASCVCVCVCVYCNVFIIVGPVRECVCVFVCLS